MGLSQLLLFVLEQITLFAPDLGKVVKDASALHVKQREVHILSGSKCQMLSWTKSLESHSKEGHVRVVVNAILEVDAKHIKFGPQIGGVV